MRVIAGKARSLRLETVDSMNTRPTTDRIKETLFNMISNDIPNSIFLDLFSGSGGIAIEALSRGASKAYLVEQNRDAVKCIEKNLAFTRLQNQAVVIKNDVMVALDGLIRQGICFDMIFMDPPYGKLLEKQVMIKLADSKIINTDTTIIIESDLDTDFDYLYDMGFEIYKTKKYKTNKHTFVYRR